MIPNYMNQGAVGANGMPVFQNNQQQVNMAQFKRFLPFVSNFQLQQLIMQAKQQGISEADIQNGLAIMNKMR